MAEPARTSYLRCVAAPAWFAVTLLLYCSMLADVFYKVDGPDLLRLVDSGERHPWHVGYLPALGAFRDALAALGVRLPPLYTGELFSAVGMATGVVLFRAGLVRLGTAWPVREFATALLALSPPALLFATVVEFHAPLMAAIGLAFWWTTVQVRRPTAWGMAVLGGLTHAAFLLHSSSIVLPAWLLPFFVARRFAPDQRGRALRLAAVAGGVHAALFLLLPQLFPDFYGWHSDWGKAAEMEASIGRPQSLDFLGEIIVQEWLLPVLPVSVLCLLAALRRGPEARALQLQFTAFALGWAPYIYVCVRQLVHEPEFGAYMLPLVPAAAFLTAQAAPRRAWPAVLVCSLVVAGIVRHEALGPPLRARYDAFVAEVEQAVGDAVDGAEPYLLMVGRYDEFACAMARLPADRFLWIRTQALMPREDYGAAVRDSTIAGLLAFAAAGRRLLLTDGALAWLEDPAAMRLSEKPALPPIPNDEFAGPAFLADLRGVFRLVPRVEREDSGVAILQLQN